jgi:predicted transcriptional regulator
VVSSKTEDVIVLPIYPKYAEAILSGTKKVEFRKAYVPNAKWVVIYATSPTKRVVGYFEVQRIDRSCPKRLWAKFGNVGIIDRDDFFDYYDGIDEGAALVISASWALDTPISMDAISSPSAPQGFRYVEHDAWRRLKSNTAKRRCCAR